MTAMNVSSPCMQIFFQIVALCTQTIILALCISDRYLVLAQQLEIGAPFDFQLGALLHYISN